MGCQHLFRKSLSLQVEKLLSTYKRKITNLFRLSFI